MAVYTAAGDQMADALDPNNPLKKKTTAPTMASSIAAPYEPSQDGPLEYGQTTPTAPATPAPAPAPAPAAPATPAPVQNVGHTGTAANGMNREQYRDAWMSSGVTNMDQARAWVAANGGQVLKDNGTIMTPFGESYDMLIGARSGNGQPGWGEISSASGVAGATGGPQQTGNNPLSASGTAGGAGTDGSGLRDPRWNDLYAQLLERAHQGLAVDPNDPVIKGQVDASTAVANREALKQQQAAAERGGAYATGATANMSRAIGEDVQTKSSSLQAELMGREVTSRRQEIAQALESMQGMLTADEQSRLRQEDQALARRQMELASAQANAQLGLQSNQQAWLQQFQDRNWDANQAQQNWDNEYKLWY